MNGRRSIDALNRLLAIMVRSLPRYLAGASLWSPSAEPGMEQAQRLLTNLVDDEQQYAAKIADLILSRGGTLDTGEFPMLFTDMHDLSLEFMLGELLNCQRQDVAAIESCLGDLANDSEARTLALEILGNARGHLQTLKELTSKKKLSAAS